MIRGLYIINAKSFLKTNHEQSVMSDAILVGIIALVGVLFAAIAAFLGSLLGIFFNYKSSIFTRQDKYAFAALESLNAPLLSLILL